jgi:hypothetical protein
MDQLRAELLAYLAAVGQDEGLESGRLLRVRGAALPTESGRQREIATRGDIDDYERSLRRRSMASYALIVLVALAAIGAGAWVWTHGAAPPPTSESEPNDTLVEADRLPVNDRVRAYLGKRLDEQRSDADFYVLSNVGGERRTVRLEVSAIPNMDLVLEVFREGINSPLLLADSGGIGAPEVVPNFVIDGPTYYLRVRELWESGRLPTENVSDAYEVSWRYVTPEDGDEREVNDSIELAEPIRVGETRRGYVGWGGDHDSFCLEGQASNVVARVEAVSSLDLVLEVVERETSRVHTYDANPIAQGEVSAPIDAYGACVVVSAHRPKDGLGHDPDERYVLHVEHGPEDAPSESAP